MRPGIGKSIVLVGAVVAIGAVPQAQCQAGPIIDWLFHRNEVPYAQPIYSQPVAAQPAYVPTATYAAGCDPCNQCQRAVTYYAPDPYYRTTWARMPVTNYRPVIAASPTAGYPVTTMQPCTTYIWQARRVPSHSAFAPIYTGYAPMVSAGCATCGSAAAAPYYAPATPTATIGPAAVSSSAIVPGVSVPGPVSGPATGAAVPADLQPSLAPPPTNRNYAPLDPVDPSLDPADGLPLNSPAAIQKKPAKNDGLRLVPDPDAPRGAEEPNRAPRLLTPREKTAAKSLRFDWAARPVPSADTPAVRPASAEASLPAKPRANAPSEEKWDDSGWRSLRP